MASGETAQTDETVDTAAALEAKQPATTVSPGLETADLDRTAARIGKTGIHRSHELLMHEATELRGRNAPLPENYPYQRRIARNRYENTSFAQR